MAITKTLRSFKLDAETIVLLHQIQPIVGSKTAVVEQSVKLYGPRVMEMWSRFGQDIDKLTVYLNMLSSLEKMAFAKEPISTWDKHIIEFLDSAYQLGIANSTNTSRDVNLYADMLGRLGSDLLGMSMELKNKNANG